MSQKILSNAPAPRGGPALRPRACRPAAQGSVLILVLVFSAVLAMLSLSVANSAQAQVEISRGDTAQLQADLMVDSALDFARRRLTADISWAGTGNGWLDLGPHDRFRVDRLDDGSDPTAIHVLLHGEVGGATVRREAMLEAPAGPGEGTPNIPLTNSVFALMGAGSYKINNTTIDGNMLVVDGPSGVRDYDPATGEWVPSSILPVNSIQDNSFSISGDIHVFESISGSSYFNARRKWGAAPVRVPIWDLDPYLVPGPDRVITTQTTFNGLNLEKTLVIVAGPGDQIKFNDCDLWGGVVIYVEPGYDPRGPWRNKVKLNNCQLGGGSMGIHPNLALIAPATECNQFNNVNDVKGLVHLEQITASVNNCVIDGVFMVTDKKVEINHVTASKGAGFWDQAFEGLDFGVTEGPPLVTAMWDSYQTIEVAGAEKPKAGPTAK